MLSIDKKIKRWFVFETPPIFIRVREKFRILSKSTIKKNIHTISTPIQALQKDNITSFDHSHAWSLVLIVPSRVWVFRESDSYIQMKNLLEMNESLDCYDQNDFRS